MLQTVSLAICPLNVLRVQFQGGEPNITSTRSIPSCSCICPACIKRCLGMNTCKKISISRCQNHCLCAAVARAMHGTLPRRRMHPGVFRTHSNTPWVSRSQSVNTRAFFVRIFSPLRLFPSVCNLLACVRISHCRPVLQARADHSFALSRSEVARRATLSRHRGQHLRVRGRDGAAAGTDVEPASARAETNPHDAAG